MTNIATTIAAEINRHHELACLRADEAIGHAQEAGKLLLQVKSDMKHGQFLLWVGKHVAVTPRQCQRYMAAAQGKPVAIRSANASPMSHLPAGEVDAPRLFSGESPAPEFLPDAGHCYLTGATDGPIYLVEPSSRHPGHLYVSRLNTDGTCDYTKRPVAAPYVEMTLQHLGLGEPAAAGWRYKACAGVSEAMETISVEVSA